MTKKGQDLIEALRTLLSRRESTTQEGICSELEKLGFEVNQSKISRLLRKIGAVKVTSINGEIIYSLPRDPEPPHVGTLLRDLIFDISANENLIVIATSPGCASTIGRILDHNQLSLDHIGTVAGDDTLLVVPRSVKNIPTLLEQIGTLLK